MVKQPKFIVRVRNSITVYDVPVGADNSIEAAKLVHAELSDKEKVIAVYQNVGDEDHFDSILK